MSHPHTHTPEAKAVIDLARFIQEMGRSIFIHWPLLKTWQRKRRMRIFIRNAEKLSAVPRTVFADATAYDEALLAEAVTGELRKLIAPEVEASTVARSTAAAVLQELARTD